MWLTTLPLKNIFKNRHLFKWAIGYFIFCANLTLNHFWHDIWYQKPKLFVTHECNGTRIELYEKLVNLGKKLAELAWVVCTHYESLCTRQSCFPQAKSCCDFVGKLRMKTDKCLEWLMWLLRIKFYLVLNHTPHSQMQNYCCKTEIEMRRNETVAYFNTLHIFFIFVSIKLSPYSSLNVHY